VLRIYFHVSEVEKTKGRAWNRCMYAISIFHSRSSNRCLELHTIQSCAVATPAPCIGAVVGFTNQNVSL